MDYRMLLFNHCNNIPRDVFSPYITYNVILMSVMLHIAGNNTQDQALYNLQESISMDIARAIRQKDAFV